MIKFTALNFFARNKVASIFLTLILFVTGTIINASYNYNIKYGVLTFILFALCAVIIHITYFKPNFLSPFFWAITGGLALIGTSIEITKGVSEILLLTNGQLTNGKIINKYYQPKFKGGGDTWHFTYKYNTKEEQYNQNIMLRNEEYNQNDSVVVIYSGLTPRLSKIKNE